MGTQVITRDTGRRLGVVGEVVVDIDRREVVALGLRDNPLTRFLPGLPRWMPLESIRQVGDVILVDSADSLSETFNPERYSKVINCQVITESGVTLGRVLGFSFDIETGELSTLVIGALGVPLLGEGVLSTWELAVGEIVSSGTDRIIVYEGAEEKLKQLGTGLLEKLGIGGSSWEQEERERFRSGMIPAENQLPAGTPSAVEQRRIQPASSRAVLPASELDYVELEERREREPLRQRLYLDEEDLRPAAYRQEGEPEPYRDPYASRSYGEPRPGERRWSEGSDDDRAGRYDPPRRPLARDEDDDFDRPEPQRPREEGPRYRNPERQPQAVDFPREAEPEAGERFQPGWENSEGETAESWRGETAQQRSASRFSDAGPERDRPERNRIDAQPRPRASEALSGERPAASEPREVWRESSAPRRNQAEPIDVEPEVLDDPW